MRAVTEARSDDDGDLPKAFLDDVRRLLFPENKPALPHMWTKDITAGLRVLDDPSADWSRAYHGTEITDYWAGKMLAHWLRPDKAKLIRYNNQQYRGVYTYQLQDAFTRHGKTEPGTEGGSKGSTVPPVPPVPNEKDAENISKEFGTDLKVRSVPHLSQPSEGAKNETSKPPFPPTADPWDRYGTEQSARQIPPKISC